MENNIGNCSEKYNVSKTNPAKIVIYIFLK